MDPSTMTECDFTIPPGTPFPIPPPTLKHLCEEVKCVYNLFGCFYPSGSSSSVATSTPGLTSPLPPAATTQFTSTSFPYTWWLPTNYSTEGYMSWSLYLMAVGVAVGCMIVITVVVVTILLCIFLLRRNIQQKNLKTKSTDPEDVYDIPDDSPHQSPRRQETYLSALYENLNRFLLYFTPYSKIPVPPGNPVDTPRVIDLSGSPQPHLKHLVYVPQEKEALFPKELSIHTANNPENS